MLIWITLPDVNDDDKPDFITADFDVMVGTPGVGVGSFVRFGHEGVSQAPKLKIEVIWLGQKEPFDLILKKRC